MNLLMPLQVEYGQDRFTGLLVLIIDPESFLVPLLKSWPLPRATAEAVLVRRHGKNIVRLSATRFEPWKPLREVVPPQWSVLGGAVGTGRAAGVCPVPGL